ncbi:MAG: AMP-binding protein [Cryobacterium sp.]|nr:AMP-binding protein [Cryobacterium sp.]
MVQPMTSRWPHLAPNSQRRRLEQAWSGLGYRSAESIGYLLEKSATTWPNQTAVITAGSRVTFAELQERSSAIARTLVAQGIRQGDAVCWMLPTGPDAIAVASALWRIGAISSPVVPLNGVSEMTNVLAQIEPRAILTVSEYRGRELTAEWDQAIEDSGASDVLRLTCGPAPAGWRRDDAEGPGALSDTTLPSEPDDPCLILFTSGTEKAAKAVAHTSAGIQHELATTVGVWGITSNDRMFMSSPMTHITGLLQGFLIPARMGATAILMDRWNGDEGVELIELNRATYMAGAAPFLRELLDGYRRSRHSESALRQYCCGGAAVPPELITGANELGIAGYKAWGMTELPTSTLPNEFVPLELRATTDGPLAPGVEIRVVDENGVDLASGEVGEMLLRGPEMMLGYVLPEHNESAFTADGWFRTGDTGSYSDDGYVRVTGRLKEIINRGGEKFSAREIEDAVAHHPDVTAAAVVAVPGGRLGEQIGVAIVSDRTDLTIAEIGSAVTGLGLAKHKQPELIAVVDALPVNPTGKIDRRAIAALFESSRKT